MEMTDRSTAPPLQEIAKITLPQTQKLHLSNGAPLWSIHAGTQEVVKLEWLFNAGLWQEKQRALAATTSKMLFEGVASKTSQQISDSIEFFGASVGAHAAVDYASVTLFTLTKHLPSLLPLLHEVITGATFPQDELTTCVQNSKQRLMVSLQKVDFLAHKEFNARLYGAEHPNGYSVSPEDYDRIHSGTLQQFHRTAYGDYKMIVAGKVNDDILHLIDDYFGSEPLKPHEAAVTPVVNGSAPGKFVSLKNDAVQSAIRIGGLCINRMHPDFTRLRVLNTILGGYFGSRLMQNLREKNGYCYGIHSGISSFLNSAHYSIVTEVGKEVTSDALREIYDEINILRNEPVPAGELQLVKNYLMGVTLADADGPFNVADIMRGLMIYGLPEARFHHNIEDVRNVTSGELLQLAQQYLNPDSMIEVVAGSK